MQRGLSAIAEHLVIRLRGSRKPHVATCSTLQLPTTL